MREIPDKCRRYSVSQFPKMSGKTHYLVHEFTSINLCKFVNLRKFPDLAGKKKYGREPRLRSLFTFFRARQLGSASLKVAGPALKRMGPQQMSRLRAQGRCISNYESVDVSSAIYLRCELCCMFFFCAQSYRGLGLGAPIAYEF